MQCVDDPYKVLFKSANIPRYVQCSSDIQCIILPPSLHGCQVLYTLAASIIDSEEVKPGLLFST